MEEHLKTMNLCLSFSPQIEKEHNHLFKPSYGTPVFFKNIVLKIMFNKTPIPPNKYSIF